MTWKFDSKLPLALQLEAKLRRDILQELYPPGSQFPTVRQLAFEASVNPNTMQKALTALEAEGLLESRGTVGRFVTADTGVLERIRSALRRDYMRRALAGAAELGITGQMFIDYIQESEGEP